MRNLTIPLKGTLGRAAFATNKTEETNPCNLALLGYAKSLKLSAQTNENASVLATTILSKIKNTPQGVFSILVEVVGIEPTSYSAAKKLSTYLVYLLFLNFATRVNTLCKTQKAEYSYKNTFRSP